MKRNSQAIIFIITLLLGIVFTSKAQAQRYLPGQKGIQLTGGLTGKIGNSFNKEPAYYIGVALSTYTKKGNRWVIGIEGINNDFQYKESTIPVVRFIGDGGYYFKLLSDYRKTYFLSFGLTASGGYETSNWGKKLLYDGATLRNKDAFIYGGSGIIELETYLSDKIILLINCRERVLFGSSIGKFQTHYGIGLKFIIN